MRLLKHIKRLLDPHDPFEEALQQHRMGTPTATPKNTRGQRAGRQQPRSKKNRPEAPAYQRFIDGPPEKERQRVD